MRRPITNSSDRETANRIEAPFTLFVHFVIYTQVFCSFEQFYLTQISVLLGTQSHETIEALWQPLKFQHS